MAETETDTAAAEQRQTSVVPFDAPGPGSWELDSSHYGPESSRLARDLIEMSVSKGLATGFELMGSPVAEMEARFVNGRFYRRLVPLVGPDRNLPPPPKPVLWLATRLHPEFRRRARTAAAALEERVWMEELERWESDWKPNLVERSRRFEQVDLEALDDAGLANHLRALMDHLEFGTALHFQLHVSDLGPIGLMLVRGREWGLDPVELMQTLSGYSHATSAPAAALAEIRRQLPDGRLESLAAIEVAPEAARRAFERFMTEYGGRLTSGYDIRDLTLAELPETVLAGINSADIEGRALTDAKALGDDTAARLREQVPAADRSEFDQIVADARALYGLRDENGPITYQWPAGLVRRAVLETGRRLLEAGQVVDREHVFDMTVDEMITALAGRPTTTAAELAERCRTRNEWAEMEAPRLLGPEPILPPVDVLPGALARMMDVTLTVIDMIESTSEREELVGVGIGEDTYVGRARVVDDAIDALADFEPGDVLVAPFTVPTINSVLAMAGAVVVEEGGLLCHAAVIAREFGIPGVVGAAGATRTILDGAEIEVDASQGTIKTVSPQ